MFVFARPPASALPGAEVAADPVGTPLLWLVTIGAILALVGLDFLLTRRPHEVSTKEAAAWSAFYIGLPLAFGIWVWSQYGARRGTEFFTGYLVEKSLSVDNLFVFMLLLGAFAVPAALQQRVLLFGIVGALVLRGVFIALGAAALQSFSATFLVFGLILLATAVSVYRDARRGHGPGGSQQSIDIGRMRSVRILRRIFAVTHDYRGSRLTVRLDDQGDRGDRAAGRGRRALTPLAVVVVAVLAADVVFAVDSVPAVFGVTDDPYLVFATNAFALLGLRALYFLLAGALSRLAHLGYGLALVLGFIGLKLVLHWGHTRWPAVPEVATPVSLVVILGILATVTATSLLATRGGRPGNASERPLAKSAAGRQDHSQTT